MNDFVTVIIKTHNSEENIVLKNNLDILAESIGMKYNPINEKYFPFDEKNKNEIVFQFIKEIRNNFDPKLISFSIEHMTVSYDNIVGYAQNITVNTNTKKFKFYEKYFIETGQLPAPILVNDDMEVISGCYIYELTKKYNIPAIVYQNTGGEPFKKTVKGRYINGNGSINKKVYEWIYDFHKPVAVNNVVTVNNKSLILVSEISYISGHSFCSEYKRVTRPQKR